MAWDFFLDDCSIAMLLLRTLGGRSLGFRPREICRRRISGGDELRFELHSLASEADVQCNVGVCRLSLNGRKEEGEGRTTPARRGEDGLVEDASPPNLNWKLEVPAEFQVTALVEIEVLGKVRDRHCDDILGKGAAPGRFAFAVDPGGARCPSDDTPAALKSGMYSDGIVPPGDVQFDSLIGAFAVEMCDAHLKPEKEAAIGAKDIAGEKTRDNKRCAVSTARCVEPKMQRDRAPSSRSR